MPESFVYMLVARDDRTGSERLTGKLYLYFDGAERAACLKNADRSPLVQVTYIVRKVAVNTVG